ncbi:MAG: peptide-modifying radical SAM enzyme CbpB [Elusimicrobia bacterium RIFCSPLOWO2_02_FULL_39_32]|nr:MAG: peptide-modifying radical SAM enzyme CbpB [Elusimicrobia bacterium GWA2_38_7]OGR81469.1 MAG: peptide-modifying radical SAM enzyme CbpB [Elusimicrobia bacterium RIFCSPHIGHO2_02_FULL_39_36]OGR91962.1 MAG: peptide-modifying radical SAM enzyme CbpB [Elusimicrobia bacterium RIFCSPLOWO2_02_FULL_39_32]OGR98746.1 MAG: peptide-modifying radical SAM enzyme CbpB [Elusimicrobia bacterium RIFCSPLOWO2_12_FULL_39_28]
MFQYLDIGHSKYNCFIEPDTAFWALVQQDQIEKTLSQRGIFQSFAKKSWKFKKEMDALRFTQKLSAVYFNPTEKCNLNCSYCYLPEKMRKNGDSMSEERILEALEILKKYFKQTLPKGMLGEIVFHGAEPMLNQKAVFAAIEKYKNDFRFGIQTNATLLDKRAVEFLTNHHMSIGISLDAPMEGIADLTRKNWSGQGVYKKIVDAMERLRGYPNWSVISTITSKNMRYLVELVEFFHSHEVPNCLLNVLRCTMSYSWKLKPGDHIASKYFLAALDRTYELYKETGRKLIVANFANILLAIIAPTARRLMCDISPCGGGRCFFALAPNGDSFPCSEFIGLPMFKGGNIFKDKLSNILISQPFNLVTKRKVEDVESCQSCVIRNFCGSPCPAEVYEMSGSMRKKGAFCEFYKEQVHYAFRVIADGKEKSYLWDHWDKGLKKSY